MSDQENPFGFIKRRKYKIFNKTLMPKAILALVVILAIMVTIGVSLIGVYVDKINRTGIGDIPEAKKVGNWEYVDSDYVLKRYEILSLEGRDIGAVTLRDNKNGNKLVIFQAEFTLAELSRTKEEVLNKLLNNYGLGGYYFNGSGTTGKYGQEMKYNIVGWSLAGEEDIGIIGNTDCALENGNKSSIFLIAINLAGKYNNDRVMEFADTLKCPKVGNNNGGDVKVDKLDTDKDGLIDKVETMLHTDPYNADSDGDGTNDGDEIKVGRNPLVHKQWKDSFTDKEFDKVKKDIKFLSIYNYDNLFPEN